MYKLYIALAFLAVAAAKPNWPLPYSGVNEFGYNTYPVGAYPHSYPIGAYPHGYSAPLVKSIGAPVVAPAPFVKSVPALGYPEVHHVAPLAPIASIAPAIAPAGYPAGLVAEPYLNYNSGFPYIVKKK